MARVLRDKDSSYYQSLVNMFLDVREHLEESRDISMHLKPLRSLLDDIEQTDMAEIEPKFKCLYHLCALIWRSSDHYRTPARVSKICHSWSKWSIFMVDFMVNYEFRSLSCFKKLPILSLKSQRLSWILKIFSNQSWMMQTNKLKLLFKFWKISNHYFLNSEQNFQLTSLESNNLFHGISSHFSSFADLTASKVESIWLLNFSLTGLSPRDFFS